MQLTTELPISHAMADGKFPFLKLHQKQGKKRNIDRKKK
jgi:hypothetical protein